MDVQGVPLYNRKPVMIIRKILFWWELPQLLLGAIIYLAQKKNISRVGRYRQAQVFKGAGFRGAISLSWLIFLGTDADDERLVKHEYGHSLQSLFLGWLYLPLVGLPSLIRSSIWRSSRRETSQYFKRFPENWADRLGKADRSSCRRKI